MNSSTRLYERLGEIPQDPEDPESLDDLVVCAFGAFERYYVCWKTRGGEYKQDGYDLPPSLNDWLFPIDGTVRDFASLQVVFGRGDEYFASDKNGKLEVKEPEIKKPAPTEGDELSERPTLRRSRTISFLRPLSDPIPKLTGPTNDVLKREHPVPRSQSFSSQPEPDLWAPAVSTSRSMLVPKVDTVEETHIKELPIASPISTPTRPARRSRPSSISFNSGSFPKIIEGKQLVSRSNEPSEQQDPAQCTCSHVPKRNTLYISTSTFVSTEPVSSTSNAIRPASKISKSTISSVHVDPIPPLLPPRAALRISTATDSDTFSISYSDASSALDVQTPLTENPPAPNPVYMGRMMDYFSKPGYQLGDSLFSSYRYNQQPAYHEGYGDEGEWGSLVADRRQTV